MSHLCMRKCNPLYEGLESQEVNSKLLKMILLVLDVLF